MSNAVITPIVIRCSGQLKKLCYLTFNYDGSIYVSFPRKNGYIITQNEDIDFSTINNLGKITLKNNNQTSSNPYISYHPSSNLVHINLQPKGIHKTDNKVLDLSASKDIVAFPLCQILFPDFQYLDIYKHRNRYAKPLEIASNNKKQDKSLSLEIFVHPVGTYFEAEDLPLYKSRVDRYVGLLRFESSNLTKNTVTVAVTESMKEVSDNSIEGVIVLVYNENTPYIFQMDPQFY